MLDPLDLLVFFAVLGVMIIVHEFGHFFAAKRAKVAVERFSLGFGPQLISFMRNGTRYAICLIPFGGFIKMAGDSLEECKGRPGEYLAQPVWKRFAIVFSGPLLNYCLGVVLFCFIFFAGYPALTSTIGEVMPGYGAEKVGLRAQDRVVAVEGRPVELWDDLQHEIFTRSSQQAIELSVVRGGSQVNVSVPLVTETAEDVLGQRRNVGRVGIKPDFNRTVFVRHTALESVSLGVKKSVDLTVLTYKAMGLIVTGRLSFKESMTGPVGM